MNKRSLINVTVILFFTMILGTCGRYPQQIQPIQQQNNMQLKADGKSDETQTIQAYIDELDKRGGGILEIPHQSRFYLAKLRLGDKVNLKYSQSSDLSNDAGHPKNSGEWYHLLSGANKGGIVNEYVVAAPFHPGLILDVRKDLSGQKHLLGHNQQMANPARASLIIRDEGMNQVVMQYKNFREGTKFSGFNIGMQRNVYVIKGAGQRDFDTKVKEGDSISNENKTAWGIVEKIEDDNITVLWTSGRFRKGEYLLANGKRSKRKVSDVSYEHGYTNSISLDRAKGYAGIGLPNAAAKYPLSVGGRIGVQGSRKSGQYEPDFWKTPAIVLAETFERPTNKGFQITGEPDRGKYRPVLKDVEGKKSIGHLGAVSAHTSFSLSLTPTPTSFNIKSITQIRQGVYRVTFKDAFNHTNYQVGLSTSHPLDYAYVGEKLKDSVIIYVVKTGTTEPKVMEKPISVICIGGD